MASSPPNPPKLSETIKVRPVRLGDFDAINRMMEPLGYNDSAYIFRLCYTSIDGAMYWVATNEEEEIIAYDSMNRLTIGDESIIFGFNKRVVPEYQGLGITRRFTQFYSHLPAMGNMTRMGFTTASGRKKFGKKLIIFAGHHNCDEFREQQQEESNATIHELDDASQMGELITYDRTVFDYDRSAYVRAWSASSKPGEQYARTVVARNRENQVIGYGTIRLFEDTYAIQPVYADHDYVAEALLRELLRLHKTESAQNGLSITIYVFAENRLMMRFASRCNLEAVSTGFRTYIEENGSNGVFRAEAIEKYICAEKIYCTQFSWPA